MLESIFGFLAMMFGLLTFLLGLSMQVWKQHKERRFGMSATFVALGTTTCVVRIVYFSLSGAYWTITPDVVGLIISFALIYQYGAYERRWW